MALTPLLAVDTYGRCVAGGWDCAVVRSCFGDAMGAGIFDAVRVHGPQGEGKGKGKGGKRAKHYACANPMEVPALSLSLRSERKDVHVPLSLVDVRRPPVTSLPWGVWRVSSSRK